MRPCNWLIWSLNRSIHFNRQTWAGLYKMMEAVKQTAVTVYTCDFIFTVPLEATLPTY